MNPSASQPPITSSSLSSASVTTSSYPHPNTITNSERINSNSRNETKISSKDTDSEGEKSQKDSFADDDSSQRNSIDIASLLSTERSNTLRDSDYCRVTSDYSVLSDTSTYDENRQTGASEVELNLTDISVPPSETSESTTLESENDYGELPSSNSERDSYKDDENYIISDAYGDRLYNTEEGNNRLLECGYDSNAEPLADNIRYYSTIIEESEEEESPRPPSSEAFDRRLNMGQHYSSSSGGVAEENAKKTKRKSNEAFNESHTSSQVSSEGWRISQASTNTNVSASTGGDSDDTLAQNMSELSSVNSHLSNLGGETTHDIKSLDRKEIKYSLRDSKNKKDDPDATPVASPLPTKKENAIIINAINELENIEQAAQNLLQQRQTSPEVFNTSQEVKQVNDPSCQKDVKDSTSGPNNFLNEQNTTVLIFDSKIDEANLNNNNIIILPTSEKKEEMMDVKPPLAPTTNSTSDNKRKQWAKCKELKPYISRESYNEDSVMKEIDALRESYRESDLNDFLDKLESSGVKDTMDDNCFEQLLADIKADVRHSKQSSTESLPSMHSIPGKKSAIRASQESLNSLSKFKASTSKKLESLKDRILNLLNVKKRHKSSKALKPNTLSKSENDKNANGTNRPVTPSSRSETPQLTDFRPLTPDLQDTKSSRPDTPEIKDKRSPAKDIPKAEEKKGFKISHLLRKGSPKILRKKHSKDSKNRKSDIATSESESEDTEIIIKDVSLRPNGSSNAKGSGKSSLNGSQELRKEVRFNLKEEMVTNNKEPLQDEQNVSAFADNVVEENSQMKENIRDGTKIIDEDNSPGKLKEDLGSEEIIVDREKEEKTHRKNIIPTTVLEMNKKLESQQDPNIRAENILLKLPERIKPPRRKKKHLIPTTVEDISIESLSKRSSDESGSSPKNSVLEDDRTQSLPLEQDQHKQLERVEIVNNHCTISDDTYDLNQQGCFLLDNNVDTIDKEITEIKNEIKPNIKIPDIQLDEIQSSEIKHDICVPGSETDQMNVHDGEGTPSFPSVDENMASFYDNVNPYYELMTKLQEEEEPEPDMIEKPIIAEVNNRTDIIPPVKEVIDNFEKEFMAQNTIEKYTNVGNEREKSFEESIKEIKYNLQLDDEYNTVEDFAETSQSNKKGTYEVGNFAHQEASNRSLEKERKAYNIDELNSLTEEIARITDDMEKDMNSERIRSGFSLRDEGLNPTSPTRYTPNSNMKTNEIRSVPGKHILSNSAQTEFKQAKTKKIKHEAASQTDTEYDETDIETDQELATPSLPAQTKHFFGPTKPYSRSEIHSPIQPCASPSQKKAPAVPPRHFQQKMPQNVVDELKSVLSDTEEPRSKRPALPPRWDTALTINDGRCNNGMNDFIEPSEVSNPSYAAKMQPDCWLTSVSAADPHIKEPSSLPLPSNNITSYNLITTSYIKNTKPNRNEKLDRRRSSSLSTENLTPIPEETSSSEINFRVLNEKTFKSAVSKVNEKMTNEQQKSRIYRVRANVYPTFASSNSHIPHGKPPVPRPPLRRVHSSAEEGYLSDPGTPKYERSRSALDNGLGYVTDSELLCTKNNLDTLKFICKSDKNEQHIGEKLRDNTISIPPPRPPPPSEENLFPLNPNINSVEKAHFRQPELINRNEDKYKVINKRLNENFIALFDKANENEQIKARPHSTDFSQTKNSFNIHQDNVYPLTKQTSFETSLQSITLSSCKAHEEHPKEENKNDAKFGTKPKSELSYLANRARPLTWCNESDFKSSCVSNVNDKMINSSNVMSNESIDLKCYEGGDSAYSESRPSSQLSQCSSQRLQAQGLGEWLFLARLDHTNQLLSQLNSTMQLQPDRSPGSSSEQHSGSTVSIKEKRKSPPPPPRPRTPIDERDPEQVLAEKRYLSYFQAGPPRTKHPPNNEAPKSPTLQQVAAQNRYENYFIGPPRADPERVNIKTPDLENDEGVLAAQRRYNSYFQGPPKPRPSSTPEKETVEDEETLEAQKRYMSYFQPKIPRPRSSVSQDKTPEPDEEQKAAEERYMSYFRSGPPRPRSNREVSQTPEPDEEQIAAEKRYLSYFRSGPPRPRSNREVSSTPEPDEEQIAAEQRYLSYFRSGPPRPRSNTEVSKTPEPDEEQIAAEKRFLKYFEGLPKAKHERKEENTTPEITAEMIAAEERFLKYFQPIPHGAPRKRVNPPPPNEEDSKKLQLFAEYQRALEGRVSRKQMKIVRVSKPKKEHEREKTPPSLREIVVEEFLQRVKDRKREKDLHFGDTDDEDDEDDIMKEIPKTLPSDEPIIQGGGTIDRRISKDLKLFVGEEGEFDWIQEWK